jgi:hypothetical protein
MIGSTARADVLRIDSKISVVQDIERQSHMQLFTPKNSISYSITMFNADVPDAISLRFIDSGAGYAHNELSVYNTSDGNRIEEPDSIQKVDLWGVTDSKQARRIGMYNYGCIKNRPFVHTIEVDIEYLVINKGDWIQYAGDIALTGSVQGRIKGIIWADDLCIGIDTDEPVPMENGNQYAVRIRKFDGTIILKEVVFSPGKFKEKSITYYPGDDLYDPLLGDIYAVDEDNVYYEPQNEMFFSEPLKEIDAPKAGDIYAFGIRGYEVLDLIITDIQPGQNFTAVLTCVEYSPEIFDVDKPDFILPVFVNRITPVSGAIDSGVVNPSNWKYFAVYHESDTEPPRPVGNGQNDGWHYAQTRKSIWQSSKMSLSIDDGEWGQPVDLRGKNGYPGDTPYIKDGYWWIGNSNTNVKAEGVDGDDGDTPFINKDGYWWIGNVNTNVKAEGVDGVTPVFLTASPQSKILECNVDGIPLARILPWTSQVRLYRGNTLISSGITWSVPSAPAGVSVNQSGLVTVAATAGNNLTDETIIIVRANYQSVNYDVSLFLSKERGSSAPVYLGTVIALTLKNAQINITKGPKTGPIRARQENYVLAVTPVLGQLAGSVFQWAGAAWEFRPAASHADLYTRCFKDGLDTQELADNTEWFGAAIIGQLIAHKAFIEEFESLFVLLKKGGIIQSEEIDPDTKEPLFTLRADGFLQAIKAVFKDITITGNSHFKGDITSGILFSSNELTGIETARVEFASGQTPKNVCLHYGVINYNSPMQTIPVPSGSFGGRPVIRLKCVCHRQGVAQGYENRWEVEIDIINNENNIETVIIDYMDRSGRFQLGKTLIIDGGQRGKIFRFVGLPSGAGSREKNDVYCDSAGFLRIAL